MKAVEVISNSARETRELGARLGRVLKAKDVLALSGALGSGKTVFVQGLAAGLGTDREAPVTSPSFVILHEYPGPAPLYHFDFYRLRKEREVRELGYEEYFDGQGVCAVEWADKFEGLFGEDAVRVEFLAEGVNKRRIILRPGPGVIKDRWSEMVNAIEG